MAKIFDVQDWLKNHPNRNNFDLTHKVHGSYQFGKLYPVLCKPVVPTDSFRIDTAVSLRFTPMPFPTQSNMRVIFHYFYVRNKNIWKNWTNWLQGLEEHTPPYIEQNSSFYKDGQLADHLGVPTSFLSSSGNLNLNPDSSYMRQTATSSVFDYITTRDDNSYFGTLCSTFDSNRFVLLRSGSSGVSTYCPVFLGKFLSGLITEVFLPTTISRIPLRFDFLGTANDGTSPAVNLIPGTSGSVYPLVFVRNLDGPSPYDVVGTAYYEYDSSVDTPYLRLAANSWDSANPQGVVFDEPLIPILLIPCTPDSDFDQTKDIKPPFANLKLSYTLFSEPKHVSLQDAGVSSPYYDSEHTINRVKVSALPFRAYESIYNAFYRNSQGVQPFIIDGVTQYNKYVSNDGDGADTTNYHLFERNWELDAYTSCLISPQQGNVPYVGITDISALGRMQVETPQGDSAEVRLSDNGDGVEISNLRGDTPEARAYALRAASSGFTIPEFREANALQRFLEMNIRKGYKYIDFIEGHFGKKPTYSELDMPEFIGGFSQRISVNEISNTNGVDNDTLGAIAGQARAIGGSKHGINHYFDDFGFVVGIMCIVPDNAYDSILPKHFNLKNPLDCYFPEFSQLSYMPLTHEELAPIQTINDPRGSSYRDLTKVFGYQRPNYDLVWYPDTVHGLFRDASGIGNSVICRRFAQRPDLSDAFLRIKPEETDTIFNYTFGDNDVALGEIVLSIKAKRPIPRLVVPTIS